MPSNEKPYGDISPETKRVASLQIEWDAKRNSGTEPSSRALLLVMSELDKTFTATTKEIADFELPNI
jgi:hypothetical protein